jgi:hypothetical protein
MKIVIFGNEKGLFYNLEQWLNAAGHEAQVWRKFYPNGNPKTAQPCPISTPDVVLLLGNFVTYEDLDAMGITNKPKRVYFNLGNQNASMMLKDWRIGMFSDKFVSYNPMHKYYQIKETQDRFADLECLPLPYDYTKVPVQDYSNATLKVCQTLSHTAMAGAYNKNTQIFGNVCKQLDIPFELIFDLTPAQALERKALNPVLADSLLGMFGTTTHEAWSLGQAVLCHVEEPILDEYEALLGARPPVVNVRNRDSLVLALTDMKNGQYDWKAKAAAGRAFMENHYNSAKLVQVYINYFESIL